MQNGTITTRPALTIERYDLRADLDAWDDAISALDAALCDASAARLTIDTEAEALERLEAAHVLAIDGGNAETRKARLTLALADDPDFQRHAQALREARHRLMNAERATTVARERCRLLRVTASLSVPALEP